MIKDSTIINNAVKEYKKALYKIITNSEQNNYVNCDKLESKYNQVFNRVIEQYDKNKNNSSYIERCDFKVDLDNQLENVNISIFGCKNRYGFFEGYDYSINKAKQNKYLLKL